MDNKKEIQEDEIDLVELTRMIWSKRRSILKVTMIFFALGLVIALTNRAEYEASCKVMPETKGNVQSGLSGLGGLAGLAGFNLDQNTASGLLTPQLYPEIVQTLPFQFQLIHEEVRFQSLDTVISSYTYFNKMIGSTALGVIADYTVGLPGKIRKLFKSQEDELPTSSVNEFIYLSKDDWKLISKYRERIVITTDEQSGIINIVVEMPDPYAAAEIAHLVVEKLKVEVTAYRTEKAKLNLEFILERHSEALKQYEEIQNKVAQFADQNRNITSSLGQVEYQRLQNELNIAFEVYKGLANQLEQAKIKVKEETPIFTVLEPIRIPVEKSSPRGVIVLIVVTALGSFLSIAFLIVRELVLPQLTKNR